MKISKIFYLSLFIISMSLIFAFCLKAIFFPSTNESTASTNNSLASTNKTTLETNKKYFDKIYYEYKKKFYFDPWLLSKKQFLNILHCFYVIFQLEFIDFGEMIIYILEKNPILIENFSLESSDNILAGIEWLLKLDKKSLYIKSLFYTKEEQRALMRNFDYLKSQIRLWFKDLRKSDIAKVFKEIKNIINAIFDTTILNTRLNDFLYFCDIFILDKDIIIRNKSIVMKSFLFDAIEYIKRKWSKILSTDMAKNVFASEFTTPEGTFSYFYIALYSLLYFPYND